MSIGKQRNVFGKHRLKNKEEFAEINKARILAGLDPQIRKYKKCLGKCGKKFYSNGKENRLCDKCEKETHNYV